MKYLRLNNQNDLADFEEQQIYSRHPEFKDKRITNLKGVEDAIRRNKEFKNDLVIVNTSRSCPICKNYDRKIYSISGRNKKYPKLPQEIVKNGGFCPNCYVGLNSFFEGISTPPQEENERVYIAVNDHKVDIHALYTKYPKNKVTAIKELRKITNCSLSEAKECIDKYYSQIK